MGSINKKVYTAQGKNGLNSVASYKFRKFYKEEGYPDSYGPAAIDMWYVNPFYGKLDGAGNAIYPSETNLKLLTSEDSKKTMFAIDFVADAFADMQAHFTNAAFQRKIKIEDSPYAVLEPRSAWMSLNASYHDYMHSLYNGFVKKYLNAHGMEKRIKNFHDFLSVFLLFVKDLGPTLPFTKTGFILSRYCPNTISGLIIDLRENDFSSDLVKTEKYIKDKNFYFFRDSAKNFGFLVDKNAPWRLVADLNSLKMRQYMGRYGNWKDTKTMMDSYYYKSPKLDVDNIKAYAIEFYNSYVIGRPYTKRFVKRLEYGDVGAVGATQSTQIKKIYRAQITREEVDNTYSARFWLKIYMSLRMYESGQNWSGKKYYMKLKRILEVYKVFDFENALGYINTWTKEEMFINLAKFMARDPRNNLSFSVIQKAHEGRSVKEEAKTNESNVQDVVSGHYTPTKERPRARKFKQYYSENYYEPEAD